MWGRKEGSNDPSSVFYEAATMDIRFKKVKIHGFLGFIWKGKRVINVGFLTPYHYKYRELSYKFKGNQYLTLADNAKL